QLLRERARPLLRRRRTPARERLPRREAGRLGLGDARLGPRQRAVGVLALRQLGRDLLAPREQVGERAAVLAREPGIELAPLLHLFQSCGVGFELVQVTGERARALL